MKISISHPTCGGLIHAEEIQTTSKLRLPKKKHYKIQRKIGCIMLNLGNDILLQLRILKDAGIT